MSLIQHSIIGKIDKVQIAIDRIRNYDPLQFSAEPYYVGYSGGKDSDAIRILCDLANVKHELVHNLTTVDAPETVYYIKSIPNIVINKPELSMWDLIVKKTIPPTRVMRYCCDALKERNGVDRVVMTGVRWSESSKRKKNRASLEIQKRKITDSLKLNADNAENRRLFENCQLKGRRILNPIIDWTDAEVWEFLDSHGCKSNPLYKCGFKRIGCLGCPMSTKGKQELEMYPKYKEMYLRAFGRMLKHRIEIGMSNDTWTDAEAVYDWWKNGKAISKQILGQLSIFEIL